MTALDSADRTVGGIGATPGTALHGEFGNALAPGTRLHEFEILSVIGQGGFGIVYLALDLTLDRKVAIKEYMPSTLASRTQAMTVAVHSAQHAETFAAGLRSFVNEARLLARFDHPSLLKVHRFWEAHGTAYMVMPYYEGMTLAKMLARLGHPPDEARLKALLRPLLDALELMHAEHCFHRDIAPDNILILPDGRPLLLDFGAARRVIGDMTQALTVILKRGYAPVEQYGDIPDMAQGAWTDLYALGSVVQFAITGHTPPQAVTRFMDDRRELLVVAGAGRYGNSFLDAMDQTLAVLPKNRPQSVAELRALMGDWLSADAVAVPTPRVENRATAAHAKLPTPPESQTDIALDWPETPATAREPGIAPPIAPAIAPTIAPAIAPVAAPLAAPAPAASSTRRGKVMAGGAAVLAIAAAVAGLAWWKITPSQRAEPAAAIVSPAPITAPVIAPVAAPVAPRVTAPLATPVTPSSPAPVETAPLAAPPSPPPQAPPVPTAAAPATAPAATPTQPAEPARPIKAATPRTPRATPPDTATAPPKPPRSLASGRCADIIQRVSIGEAPSDADKNFLKQECGR